MPLEAGQPLLHYRLLEKIGEGGMGVVWKAHDTTLDRAVAIKVLPEIFSADAERLGRFQREAKTLASLNHPSIASIFGLHEAAGLRFLAMEYVEGEDLAERLRRGALPVEEALAIARAIADALSTAHAIGVVHRDLKPANVMLTADGTPKVLDFGLAKAVAPDPSLSGSAPARLSLSPTVTSFGTGTGAHVILGTAAYMAPEQARGKPVDRRADVWALGAVLYEMLTGMAPFGGETISDTLAAVLKTEPAWEALPLATPRGARRLLRRCLQKDPRNRLHDAADARIELAEALEESEEDAPAAAPTGRGTISPAIVAGIAALALLGGAALGFALRGGNPPAADAPPPKIVTSIQAPPGVTISVRELSLAMSPDGEQLAFVGVDGEGKSRLYVRRLDTGEARILPETEGARTPFWSPDGRELGYHVETRLMRTPVEGGTPRLVTEALGDSGTWAADGTIVFAPSSGLAPLLRVDAGGGDPVPLEGSDLGQSVSPTTPQFLPDGRHFIFAIEDLEGDRNGVYLGQLDSKEVRRLVAGFTNGAYADGHLLYTKDGSLLAQRLDDDTLEPIGEPSRVAGNVMRLNYPFHGMFAAAVNGGRLAYLAGGEATGRTELLWVDRSGAEIERTGIQGDLYNPRLSHDGRLLAVDMSTLETHGDIWVFDLARGSSRRLTQDPIDESRPVWTPDDSEVVFFRIPDLYAVDAAGRSDARRIYGDALQKYVHDVSPDGRWVMFVQIAGGQPDLRLLDRQSGEARDWLCTATSESGAQFSPDGAWVAYQSNEPGRLEVWVDRFPDRGERFRVSAEGGSNPTWRRDGKELFYVSLSGDLMAVAVDMDSERSPIGEPRKLFSPRLRRDHYDVSLDGQRFLLNQRIDVEVSSMVLVQGWTAGPGK